MGRREAHHDHQVVFLGLDDQQAFGHIELLFGEEAGLPARSAVGVCSLPGGAACELEALVELFPQSSE